MNTTPIPAAFLANLAGAALTQLEAAANIASARVKAAGTPRARAIWSARFGRIDAEVALRGLHLLISYPGSPWVAVNGAEYTRVVNDPRRLAAFQAAMAS